MKYPNRKNNRLHSYDYNTAGAYFITICAKGKKHIFGKIKGDGSPNPPQLALTPAGETVKKRLVEMCGGYDKVDLGDYVIMPNHVHFILLLRQPTAGASGAQPATRANQIVPSFVSALKRLTNREADKKMWQRGYYDHVIRDDADYLKIASYIQTNPVRWAEDCFYCPDDYYDEAI